MYKIISDGSPVGTKVLYNSEELKGVKSITINCTIEGIIANIEVLVPTLDINIDDTKVYLC